jgi:polyribonucleotide nucleotidyltransferase
MTASDETLAPSVKAAFEEVYKKVVRERILKKGLRPDGRKLEEIRPIWCEVDISPRAHGSGLSPARNAGAHHGHPRYAQRGARIGQSQSD